MAVQRSFMSGQTAYITYLSTQFTVLFSTFKISFILLLSCSISYLSSSFKEPKLENWFAPESQTTKLLKSTPTEEAGLSAALSDEGLRRHEPIPSAQQAMAGTATNF